MGTQGAPCHLLHVNWFTLFLRYVLGMCLVVLGPRRFGKGRQDAGVGLVCRGFCCLFLGGLLSGWCCFVWGFFVWLLAYINFKSHMIISRYFGSSHQCRRTCVLINLYPYLECQNQGITLFRMSGEKVKEILTMLGNTIRQKVILRLGVTMFSCQQQWQPQTNEICLKPRDIIYCLCHGCSWIIWLQDNKDCVTSFAVNVWFALSKQRKFFLRLWV